MSNGVPKYPKGKIQMDKYRDVYTQVLVFLLKVFTPRFFVVVVFGY